MEEVQPTRQDIVKDLRNWSLHFLEVRNEHLGGMPACPFAKHTWKQNKVRIEIKPKQLWYKKTLNGILEDFDWSKHEILIFCDLYHNYSPDDLENATEAYNLFYNPKDLYFMSFHPSNPATVEEQEFLVYPTIDFDKSISYPQYDYSMMLVQKFSQLQEASDKLHKLGYYDKWPRGYYNEVVKSRYKKFNKLFGGTNGDEEKSKTKAMRGGGGAMKPKTAAMRGGGKPMMPKKKMGGGSMMPKKKMGGGSMMNVSPRKAMGMMGGGNMVKKKAMGGKMMKKKAGGSMRRNKRG